MAVYDLYLESGPQHKRTMVHVPQLLGCMANGPTTDAALAATPVAIDAYWRFLKAHGEKIDAGSEIQTVVKAHVTEGVFLGNGSPSVTYETDIQPLTPRDIDTYLRWLHHLRETLAAWADVQSDEALDTKADGRTGRGALIHILGVPGAYLSPALGGTTGFSRIVTQVERGQLPIGDGLRQVEARAAELIRATTREQRHAVIERPKELRTLRKAIRRILEHDWEHLAELSRRDGGPSLE